MMIRSKNFLVLIIIFLLSGLFVLAAQHYFDIDPNNLIACPEEAVEPCEDDLSEPAEQSDAVDSFADCVAAGNPVMESYPRQCIHEGRNFVEEVPVPIACPADAKVCPDGSTVSRTGPDCAFAKCSATLPEEPVGKSPVVCTEAMKQAEFCTLEYAPVCGLVDVQCVTTPCDPVPETFGNGCAACAQGNVISYELGACEGDA